MERPIGKSPSFDVDLRLDDSNLPRDATVFVEAYHRNTLQRFSFGTVGQVMPPSLRVLDQIDLSGPVLFRIRIVDQAEYLGRVIASVDGVRPAADEDEAKKSSLLVLRSQALGNLTWKVSFVDGEKPELIINNSIPDALSLVRSNPIFQALILPAALREVLIYFLWNDEPEEGSVEEGWIRFAELMAGEKPSDRDPSVLLDWVNDVVDRFSERFELCDMLIRRLEESGK